MDLAQAAWFIDEGIAALQDFDSESGRAPTADSKRARHFATWQADLLREQIELRRRSSIRFPDPDRWCWTLRSLAQASDWWCARFKASSFPRDVAVFDGCCGAGVDLVALAERGPAIGIDRDPVLVLIANANLAMHGVSGSLARIGDLPSDLLGAPPAQLQKEMPLWLHVDPDRRSPDSVDRRLRKAENYSPTLDESLQMARACEAAMVKLAPSSIIEAEVEKAFRSEVGLTRCWLGNLGECRQQLLLTGKLADARSKHAVVLCEPHAEPLVMQGSRAETIAGCEKPLRYIYDCHAVLHASQLQLTWAATADAEPLGTSQGYFTSDVETHSPLAQTFEVIDVLPWDQRRVKRWLREHRIGEVEVKKRLLQLDANEHQRQLRGAGEAKITLMITRLGQRVRAIVARRIPAESSLPQPNDI